MNIDPSTPEREVLIRYLESSGVNQQKEAAAEMRKMEIQLKYYERKVNSLYGDLETMRYKCDGYKRALIRVQKTSIYQRIALWFKKGE